MSKRFRLSACAAAMLLAAGPVLGVVSLPIAAQAQTADSSATPSATPAPAAGTPTPVTPDATAPGAAAPNAMSAAPGAPGAPAAPGAAPVAGAPAAPGATPAAATPAAPTLAPAATATVANPYGFVALWKNGDAIARGVIVILAIMSIGTWYIMITKVLEQAKLMASAKQAAKDFWSAGGTVRDNLTKLPAASPFRFIAAKGLSATEHHEGTLVEQIDLNTWVGMSVQRAVEIVQSRLRGGLSFLATVGSTSPFVGLFGTVWGIYHALTAIGIAGQASIDKVAGPVGEALIMTAMGLAVAVPAVLGYNWLVQRNKAAMEQVRNFSADIHSVLLSGKVSTVGGQGRGA